MNTREFESLFEFNAAGVSTVFTNPKEQVNARAANDYDAHTWVSTAMISPWSWLSLSTKLKSEVVKREGNSSYPTDAAEASGAGGTPDGVIDRDDVSLTNAKAVRWGEGLSLRFTGIPRTALYTELEFEQGRVLLREDRRSLDGPDTGSGVSAGEVFNRETVTDVRRGAWTLGGHAAPWPFLDVTTQVRRRVHTNDYDDQRETANPLDSTARSAFIDGQSQHTNEVTTRATLHPCRWFRSSVRYQFRGDKYATHVEAQPMVKTGMRSHIYTVDAALQPLEALTTTASFSRQTAAVFTPARLASSANTPTFNADVNTWLLSADYAPLAPVTLTGTLQYSTAENFNDFSATGLPLGVDNDRLDVTTRLTWALDETTSVAADYGFYRFQANANAQAGDYDAHAISVELSKTF
jgi:hypothetical protein